jgi:PPM family protein phosphatase
MIESAGSSHTGLVRKHNEDCFEANPAQGLWLVADGVGGHQHGEVAAAIARDTVSADIAAGAQLVDAVRHAHQAIVDEIKARDTGSDMGSTVVAMLLDPDNRYEIVWVGDSRAYLFDGGLRQLTRDHTPVSELLRSGTITPEQAAIHPDRHVLSQSLGISENILVAPGRVQGTLEAGQQILLCTDGLTDELSDTVIGTRMGLHSNPQQQVDDLLSVALAAGGRDNITAIVVGAAANRESCNDLESTHNLPMTIPQDSADPVNHDAKIWIMLAAMVLVGLWFWW